MGLQYPSHSDFFKRVHSLGDLPDDVRIHFHVFSKSATSACVIYGALRTPIVISFQRWRTETLKLGDILLTTDTPTTSPILMLFWRFGPSLTTSPDKSDLINAPSGGCGAEVGIKNNGGTAISSKRGTTP